MSRKSGSRGDGKGRRGIASYFILVGAWLGIVGNNEDLYRGCYQGSLSHSLFAHLISLDLSARLIPAYGFGATRLSVQPNLRTKERGEIGELGIEILQIVVGRNRSIE